MRCLEAIGGNAGPLGGDDEFLPGAIRLPDMGHGEQIRPKTVSLYQRPMGMRMPGVRQLLAAQGMECPLHRIERLGRAGEQAEFAQGMELFRHFRAIVRAMDFSTAWPQFDNRHPVLGQSARLVGAQHGCGAEGFDRRGTPREHPGQRDSPRAHGHEDGQYDRKLFRQQ